ncbi:MAG: hypothetical protein ACRD3T_19925, partial [Terriglobia bacterium]
MRETGAKQGLMNLPAAVLVAVAAICMATAPVFGQSQNQQRRSASEWDGLSRFRPVLNLGSGSVLNQRIDVGLALGGHAAGAGVLLLNPGRGGTINNRGGSLALG